MKINTGDAQRDMIGYWNLHKNIAMSNSITTIKDERHALDILIKQLKNNVSYTLSNNELQELSTYMKLNMTKSDVYKMTLNDYKTLFSIYKAASRHEQDITKELNNKFKALTKPNNNIKVIFNKDIINKFEDYFMPLATSQNYEAHDLANDFCWYDDFCSQKLFTEYDIDNIKDYINNLSRYFYLVKGNLNVMTSAQEQLTNLVTMTQGLDINNIDLSPISTYKHELTKFYFNELYSEESTLSIIPVHDKESLDKLSDYCTLGLYLEFVKTHDLELAKQMNLITDDRYNLNYLPEDLSFLKDTLEYYKNSLESNSYRYFDEKAEKQNYELNSQLNY